MPPSTLALLPLTSIAWPWICDRHFGRGGAMDVHPPPFDESFVEAHFSYGILAHIRHQGLDLEEEETRRGQWMLWALHNFLARLLKEREQEKSKATGWIVELSSFHNHSSSSLKQLVRDVRIDFPPNVPSPPLLLPCLHTPLVGSSSPPITHANGSSPYLPWFVSSCRWCSPLFTTPS